MFYWNKINWLIGLQLSWGTRTISTLLEGKKLLAHDHGDWHAFMFFPPPMTMGSPFRPWSWGHGRLFIQITMTMGLKKGFHGTMQGLKYMLNILFLHMAMGSDMNFCSSLHPWPLTSSTLIEGSFKILQMCYVFWFYYCIQELNQSEFGKWWS